MRKFLCFSQNYLMRLIMIIYAHTKHNKIKTSTQHNVKVFVIYAISCKKSNTFWTTRAICHKKSNMKILSDI